MLKLDNKPLSYDRAFTHDGIQYPANWLRLSSLEERNALGITEVADAQIYDQRFYWGVGNPKDLDELKASWNEEQNDICNDEPILDKDGKDTGEIRTGLKTEWKTKQDDICNSLLHGNDWRVVRAAELGQAVASVWLTYRGAVRSACNTRQSEIAAVTTVEALKELFFGAATVTRQKTDADGKGIVEPDTITEDGKEVTNPAAGNPVMETVANPGLATAWPNTPT
mgnify:CR=1 FL=1